MSSHHVTTPAPAMLYYNTWRSGSRAEENGGLLWIGYSVHPGRHTPGPSRSAGTHAVAWSRTILKAGSGAGSSFGSAFIIRSGGRTTMTSVPSRPFDLRLNIPPGGSLRPLT